MPPLLGAVAEPTSDAGYAALANFGLPGVIPGLKPGIAALKALAQWINASKADPKEHEQ